MDRQYSRIYCCNDFPALFQVKKFLKFHPEKLCFQRQYFGVAILNRKSGCIYLHALKLTPAEATGDVKIAFIAGYLADMKDG